MREPNELFLYEHIHELINQFTYSYEEGIQIEITHMFSRLHAEGKIQHFTLLFDHENQHFRVIITLKEYSLAKIHSLFWSFIRFISYSGATILAKKQMEKRTHYEYASFGENGRGFCCEVDFLAEVAEAKREGHRKDYKHTYPTISTLNSGLAQQPRIKWQHKVEFSYGLSPIALQDVIYSASGYEQEIYAIDAEHGTLRWHWEAISDQPSGISASLPSVEHGVLYLPIRSLQNRQHHASFYAINLHSGQTLQHFPVSLLQPMALVDFFTVSEGVAYLSGTDCDVPSPSPDQHIVCQAVDLRTGAYKWVKDVGQHAGISAPIVAHGRIYLVTHDSAPDHQFFGHVHALNPQTGEEIWQHTFPMLWGQEIAIVDTDIFVVGTTLEVIDAMTGEKRWALPEMNVVLKGAPIVCDELVCISYERIVADMDELEKMKPHETLLAGGPARVGGILAVDRASRKVRWMVEELTRGHCMILTEGAVIADGVLYTVWYHCDMSGCVTHATLYALNVHTGQERWRFEADHLSAPCAANGRVFIQGKQGEDHYLFALY